MLSTVEPNKATFCPNILALSCGRQRHIILYFNAQQTIYRIDNSLFVTFDQFHSLIKEKQQVINCLQQHSPGNSAHCPITGFILMHWGNAKENVTMCIIEMCDSQYGNLLVTYLMKLHCVNTKGPNLCNL